MAAQARCARRASVSVVPGATHLFEEPGTLAVAAGLARDWFAAHLSTVGTSQGLPSESGFRLLPHTADVMVAAWAPTVDGCLAEAARGLVSSFADVARGGARSARSTSPASPGPEPELLVELLEEVIYVVDAEDAVPVQVAVARTAEGGLVGEFGVVDRSTVEAVGPAPKAVTRHGLRVRAAPMRPGAVRPSSTSDPAKAISP